MSQLNKIDLRVFCEKLPFDSLISSESYVFLVGFLYVLIMYHVRIFIVENMGFGMAPRRCEIRSKPQPLLQKPFLSYASPCMHALARIRRLLPTYAG